MVSSLFLHPLSSYVLHWHGLRALGPRNRGLNLWHYSSNKPFLLVRCLSQILCHTCENRKDFMFLCIENRCVSWTHFKQCIQNPVPHLDLGIPLLGTCPEKTEKYLQIGVLGLALLSAADNLKWSKCSVAGDTKIHLVSDTEIHTFKKTLLQWKPC